MLPERKVTMHGPPGYDPWQWQYTYQECCHLARTLQHCGRKMQFMFLCILRECGIVGIYCEGRMSISLSPRPSTNPSTDCFQYHVWVILEAKDEVWG